MIDRDIEKKLIYIIINKHQSVYTGYINILFE
jgi:hypothetical protein